MMAGMITGAFSRPMPLWVQKEFFNVHTALWAAHCFSDLEKAESAVLYAPVGQLWWYRARIFPYRVGQRQK